MLPMLKMLFGNKIERSLKKKKIYYYFFYFTKGLIAQNPDVPTRI